MDFFFSFSYGFLSRTLTVQSRSPIFIVSDRWFPSSTEKSIQKLMLMNEFVNKQMENMLAKKSENGKTLLTFVHNPNFPEWTEIHVSLFVKCQVKKKKKNGQPTVKPVWHLHTALDKAWLGEFVILLFRCCTQIIKKRFWNN